jgi:ABC-type Fe3+ transport system permease subunit
MMPRLMLPAWATVVLAIGGAVIGALAGIIGAYFGYTEVPGRT